jgi:hypothetical protein
VNGQDMRVYFPNPKATLPVRTRRGGTQLLAWGRRHDQAGELPVGGWARLDTIYGGRWDRWFPVRVKLLVKSFMEKDLEGHSHWYDLTRGMDPGAIARHRMNTALRRHGRTELKMPCTSAGYGS